jgi:hypothetical protein
MPEDRTAAPVTLGRRQILALPAVAAAATAAAPLFAPSAAAAAPAAAAERCHPVDGGLRSSVERAFVYLDTVQDAYVKGSAPRLLQSYNNESGLMTTGFVYDNALAILAYLAHPTRDHLRRAKIIGDGLLFIQANDEKYTDGRVRQAYATGPMLFYDGTNYFPGLKRQDGKASHLWPFGFGGSSTGDMAWASLALVQLYAKTRVRKYLGGAVALGEWIATKRSPYKYGGYHGGIQADGEKVQKWTSTEHNIDVFGLFQLLAKHTGNRAWRARATVAGDFVRQMWNRKERFFWTGTLGGLEGEDPNLINESNIPEDVQTWAMLSLRDRRYDAAADWNTENLWNTDGKAGRPTQLPAGVQISGVTYSSQAKALTGIISGGDVANHQDNVWLEGNGHQALALLQRDRYGDRALAKRLLRETTIAQEKVGAGQTVGLTTDTVDGRLSNPGAGGTWTGTVLPAKSGIVATTSAFDTGFAFSYFQRQHVGATSWHIMAALNSNPWA